MWEEQTSEQRLNQKGRENLGAAREQGGGLLCSGAEGRDMEACVDCNSSAPTLPERLPAT